MKVLKIEELDQLARNFINGEVEPLEISGLNIFDMWAVLTLAAAYSCTKIGTMSPKLCANIKYNILSHYEMFRTRTIFFEKMYDDWITRTREYSTKRTELVKLIKSEDADVTQILAVALRIIDLLTKEDIYLKFFELRQNDKMFKAHALRSANKNIDYLMSKFGEDVPYARLLERFYTATCDDKIADLFEQLDSDHLRDKARRGIPVKKEPDECKAVARSIEKEFRKP